MIVYQIMEIINVIQEQPRAYFLIKLVIACIAYIIVGFIFYLGYIASNGFLDMLFFGLLIMTCIFLIFTKVRSFIKRTNDTYTTMFIDYILLALSIVFIVSIVI